MFRIRQAKGELYSTGHASGSVKLRGNSTGRASGWGNSTGHASRCRLRGVHSTGHASGCHLRGVSTGHASGCRLRGVPNPSSYKGELHRARVRVSPPRCSESVKLRGNSTGACRLRGFRIRQAKGELHRRPCRIRQAKGELDRARVRVSPPRCSESVKLRGNSTGHASGCRLRSVPNPSSQEGGTRPGVASAVSPQGTSGCRLRGVPNRSS